MGTLSLTWAGADYPGLSVSVDVVPVVRCQSFVALMRPRHFDHRLVGSHYSTSLEVSAVLLDRNLLLSLDKAIKQGYCLAKITRSSDASPLMTRSGQSLTTEDVLQSYLLKSALFWVLDPQGKFGRVYHGLSREAVFQLQEEDRAATLRETVQRCKRLVRLVATERVGLCGEADREAGALIEQAKSLIALCQDLTPSGMISADGFVAPYLMEAQVSSLLGSTATYDTAASVDIKSYIHWARRIFRMIKYLFQNGRQMHNYHLSPMEIPVRDQELAIRLCERCIGILDG